MVIGALLGLRVMTGLVPRGCWTLDGAFAGSGDRGRGLGRCSVVRVGRRWLSAGGGLERFELGERGGELGDPRPVVVEVELGAPSGEGEPAGDVQKQKQLLLDEARRRFAGDPKTLQKVLEYIEGHARG